MGLWCPWAPHSHPNMQTEKSSQVDKQQEHFVLNAVVSPVITRHFSEGEKKVSQAFLDLEDLVLCSPQPIGLPSRHGADLLLTHQAPRLRLPLRLPHLKDKPQARFPSTSSRMEGSCGGQTAQTQQQHTVPSCPVHTSTSACQAALTPQLPHGG